MIINNLELSFDRQEKASFIFKTSLGEEVSINKKLLADFSEDKDKNKKIFLNLDYKQILERPHDVLNKILETNNE